jgi:DNA repair exonuclease SbcCD ATPase subunit
MILNSIQTKNFKAIGTKSFEFSKGLNFVLGENGKGKTTLFRAISVALYGANSLPGVSDNIASWGETSWSLELSFMLDSNTYCVKRSKSSASLYCGEELIASGHPPVTKAVEELLKMNLKDFDLLVHSKQDETDHILNYGATALQRKVEELAGVDVIEAISRRAREERRASSMIAEGTHVPEDVTGQIQEIEKEIASITLNEVIRPTEPSTPISEAARLLKYWNKHQADLLDLAQINERVAELRVELDETPMAELIDLKPLKSKVKELKDEKSIHDDIVASLKSKQRQLESIELKEVDEEYEIKWQDHKAWAERNNAELDVKMTDLQNAKAELEVEISHLKSHIENGECSACGSKLLDGVEEAEANLQVSESKLKGIVDGMREVKKCLDTIKGRTTICQQAYLEEKNKVESNEKSLAKKAELEEELSQPIPTFDETELEKASLELIKAEEFNDSICKVQESRLALERRIKALENTKPTIEDTPSFTQENYNEVEAKWEAYYFDLDRFMEYTKELQYVTNLRDKVANLKDIKVRRDNALEQIKEAETRSDKLKELDQYLGGRREQYLKEIWDSVMSVASDILNTYTEGWITELSVMEGKFVFMENGVWIPSVEASGAQKSFIGVALRQALKKCLQGKSGFMLFDEPTGAMSETRARQLVDSLTGAAPQVFVITHRQTDSNLADNILNI